MLLQSCRTVRLSPDCLSRLHDHAQFALLIIHRDPIADDRAGEATLWTEGQPIERHTPTRLPDARGQLLWGLPARSFGRDQPQDDDLIIRYLSQGVEGARAIVIVLEQ